MPSSMLPRKVGALAVTAAIFGVLLGGQPALATQIAGVQPNVSVPVQHATVFSTVRLPAAAVANPVFRQGTTGFPTVYYPNSQFGANAPYGYTGSPYGYGSVPYGYTGTPYGYGSSPYGYSTPTGYPGTPYGYGTTCVNGVGTPYSPYSTQSSLLLPVLSAAASMLGNQNPMASALLTGLTSAQTAGCVPQVGQTGVPYGYGTPPYGTASPYGYGTASPYGYGTSPYATAGCVPTAYGTTYPNGTAYPNGVAYPNSAAYPNGAAYPYPVQTGAQGLVAPALAALAALGGQSAAAAALLSGFGTTAPGCTPVAYGPTYSNYPAGYYNGYNGYNGYQNYASQPIVNNYYITRVIRVNRIVPMTPPVVSPPMVVPPVITRVTPPVTHIVPVPSVAAGTPHTSVLPITHHVATPIVTAHVSPVMTAHHVSVAAPHVAAAVRPHTVTAFAKPRSVTAFAKPRLMTAAAAPRIAAVAKPHLVTAFTKPHVMTPAAPRFATQLPTNVATSHLALAKVTPIRPAATERSVPAITNNAVASRSAVAPAAPTRGS